MIRFLRTFALAGGALMVAAALGLTWHLRDAETKTVLEIAEDNNIALARALANAMRERVLVLIDPAAAAPGEALAAFRADVVSHLHDSVWTKQGQKRVRISN